LFIEIQKSGPAGAIKTRCARGEMSSSPHAIPKRRNLAEGGAGKVERSRAQGRMAGKVPLNLAQVRVCRLFSKSILSKSRFQNQAHPANGPSACGTAETVRPEKKAFFLIGRWRGRLGVGCYCRVT